MWFILVTLTVDQAILSGEQQKREVAVITCVPISAGSCRLAARRGAVYRSEQLLNAVVEGADLLDADPSEARLLDLLRTWRAAMTAGTVRRLGE